MKPSDLRKLIKEVVGEAINEFVGDKPAIGQKYIKVTVVEEYIGSHYKGEPQTSVWPNVLANDEETAKKQVLGVFNMKVVKIHSIKAELVREVGQQDIEKYDKDVAYYAHALRPKDQGGYGSH
jgi:hypothetical protein